MSSALQKKLRVTAGTAIRTVNAPVDYAKILGKLPKDASIAQGITKGHAFIHLFVKSKAELKKEFPKARKALAPDGLLWVSFPKGGSGIQTDLNRDRGWEAMQDVPMRWLALIAFDDTWSAFLMQNSPPKAASNANADYHANAAQWADAKTKTVKVPDDLAAAFKKSAKAKQAFEALAYTNRKEYVMWVVGAKRAETRVDRLKKTVEKLLAGKKTPQEK
ncbi:MAG TPA: YdeI/OmpD-associated family protein [Flavobacteriales bacterium]|jgi:hypothetical protein|nr:YdeI/OmpD-associated family protein [Flavobacteriales bacterium]